MNQTHLSEIAGQLEVVRCWCGVQHGVPQSLLNNMRRQHRDGLPQNPSIYCPLGHSWTFKGEGRAEQLEREIVRQGARLDQEKAATAAALKKAEVNEKRRRAEKGAKTKLIRRAAAGVCPCCRRTFANMAEHMRKQHPKFRASAELDAG